MPAPAHYHALVALAEAWPFCAPEAFEHGAVRLDPAVFASGFEAHARVLGRGQSLAALEAIRDRAWFDEASDRPHLHHMLVQLATRHLRLDGDTVRLANCAPDSRHGQTMGWRWLSLRLPQDLLIAALAAHSGDEPNCDRVRLVGRALAPVLERPIAETHLHVGAAIDFGMLWVALLESATRPQFGASITEGPAPFSEPGRYRRSIVAAGLVRQLLFSYLWHLEVLGSRSSSDFGQFIDHSLPAIAGHVGASARASTVENACQSALVELRTGLGQNAGSKLPQMLRAHHLLWGRRAKIVDLDSLVASDPLSRWLWPQAGRALPETRFIYRALLHLRSTPTPDPHFERALWQYLRVRNLVFGHLVESPGTAGLRWFTRHYDRLSAHRGRLSSLLVESGLHLQSRDLNLASLEVRTSPDSRWYQVRDQLRGLAKQATQFRPKVGRARPEVALTLHFIKRELPVGRYQLRCRYGPWFHDANLRANAVARALHLNPELMLLLRGLDVAAHELAVPTWTLLPLFERVHRASRTAAARLAVERPDWDVQPLRTTLHAGEEFRRLSEGLRRIHETVEFGLLGEGDRIGHGLALGWSAEAWTRDNPISVQPREERLFDLIWELDRYRRGDLSPNAGRRDQIANQLHEHSEQLFTRPIPEAKLLAFRRELHSRSTLFEELNFPYGGRRSGELTELVEPVEPIEPIGLVARYLLDPGVRRRASALVEVHTDDEEREFLDQAQTWLRAQLGRLGVTIEANPSSNLVIGDFTDLREHPTFRLSPIDGSDSSSSADLLPVSINSDDPLTFASCLADEYAYMEAALLGRVPARSALAWLDRAREAGWRSRFSLRASRDLDCLARLIDPTKPHAPRGRLGL